MLDILIYTIKYTKKGKKYNYHTQNKELIFNLPNGHVDKCRRIGLIIFGKIARAYSLLMMIYLKRKYYTT